MGPREMLYTLQQCSENMTVLMFFSNPEPGMA